MDSFALPFGCVPCDPCHQNSTTFLFCGLYGVNYTDSRVWYPGTAFTPHIYLGLVLHYNWYYSTIYNIHWCLILLCDGQLVSDQKKLKSKQDQCSKKALHTDENVSSCRSAMFIEASCEFKWLFGRTVQSLGCPSLLPFACSQ